MNWDDERPRPARTITVGEPIDTHGLAELRERVAALEAEITRTKAEIERKRSIEIAAASLFKS
ncbi:MAG: hypothetical protein CTY20_08975 [Hyphomicrobium sp.]|nr:MAG: hypothetical protein CTY20_08975 [Hyphomicrobium sp.]